MSNPVRASIQHALSSEHIRINREKYAQFVEMANIEEPKHWTIVSPLPLSDLDEQQQLSFLCVLNSISFSYWGDPKWTVEFQGKLYDGAQGMMACLLRALEEGIPVLDPAYLANITKEQFAHILRGNIEIPMFEQRYKIIKEFAHAIMTKFDGDIDNLVKQAQFDALNFVELLITEIPSFADELEYKGTTIQFNKRAQLLAADIHHATPHQLQRHELLTACADYKLPQILRRFDIFEYSEELQEQLRNYHEFDPEDPVVVEIRAHTIQVVDELAELLPQWTVNEINDLIWVLGQVKLHGDEPYHRTRTTAY